MKIGIELSIPTLENQNGKIYIMDINYREKQYNGAVCERYGRMRGMLIGAHP